jgi:phenylpropionate dioxygenase-like ring-hydroxylating dioxygenase large terminal subunit
MQVPDRVPKGRYYDPEYFQLEVDQLWSRVWQMACRLEEIPEPHDYVEYRLLDQSVIMVRDADGGVRALRNTCRHRGVRLVEGTGSCRSFVCPFHGWCYGLDGVNTFVPRARTFSPENLEAGDIDLTPVRCETWGGCAWINFDADAPPLRECIEPFATVQDAWDVDAYRVEWWRAIRLPVNWKLAEAAFVEQYHVLQSHPQLRIPGRMPPRDETAFDPQEFLDAELHYLRTMNEGMAGMVHASDLQVAERLRDEVELPADYPLAYATWNRTLNDEVVRWHRDQGHRMPDLNELEASGLNQPMGYCFPHYFLLPMYSSASSYRFRPLGPESTLMEIWSLTRYPESEARPRPEPPEVWEVDDPRVPPIPTQDFSNLPKQQQGLHNGGFDYLRLSAGIEGGVGNFEQTVDGFLAGLPYKSLLPALHTINVNPLDTPTVDLGLTE